MIFFAFLVFYFSLFIFEYCLWKNIATPYIMTTFPIVFLLIFNQLIGVELGFYSINNKLLYFYFSLGFLSIFLSSIFVRLIAKSQKLNFQKKNNVEVNSFQIKNISIFLKIFVLLKIFQVFILFAMGIHPFQMKESLGSGFSGITTLLLIICIVFFYGVYRKINFSNLFFLFISLIPLFLYGTRGWMFIAILGGILFKGYYHNIWPNKLYIALAPIFGISFMMISYVFRNASGGVDASVKEMFEHVIGYFVSGVQGANQLFGSSVPTSPYLGMTYSAIINLIEFLIGNGNYVSNVGPAFFNINHINPNISNVNTAFGTVFHGLGPIFAIFHFFILYFFLYIFYLLKNKIRSIFLLMFYSIVTSGIFLSFFEYYLGLIFYFFAIAFFVFLYLYVKFLDILKRKV